MRAWRRGCWSDRIRELRTLREQARREQQARRYGLPDLSEVTDTDRREFVRSAQAPQTHRGGFGGLGPPAGITAGGKPDRRSTSMRNQLVGAAGIEPATLFATIHVTSLGNLCGYRC